MYSHIILNLSTSVIKHGLKQSDHDSTKRYRKLPSPSPNPVEMNNVLCVTVANCN